MKKTLLLTTALSALATTGFAQCAPAPANIYAFTYNGSASHYEVIKEKLNWTNAAACAVARGGKLAEINSKAENDSVFAYVNKAGINNTNTVAPDGGGASYVWLGGNDIATEGSWVWDGDNNGTSVQFWQGTQSGSAVGGRYSNWGNEPDNFNGIQDALGLAITDWPLGVAGQWNDLDPANQLYYVIEYANPLSVISQTPVAQLKIYPNPATGIITVSLSQQSDAIEYQLTDMAGKTVMKGVLTPSTVDINIAQLPAGVYFLKLDSQIRKVVKQ